MERVADRVIWKLAITAAFAGGAIALYGRAPLAGDEPYKMVDELLKTDLSSWTHKELKVHGWVVDGRLVDVWKHQPTTSFELHKGGKNLTVIATTPSTWLLRPQMELVVHGHLVPASSVSIVDAMCAAGLDGADPSERCRIKFDKQDYVFIATELNARCPGKYDGYETCRCPPAPSDTFR